MKMVSITILIIILLMLGVGWLTPEPLSIAVADVQDGYIDITFRDGDPNDPNFVEFIVEPNLEYFSAESHPEYVYIDIPKPTHRCPVHGELGADYSFPGIIAITVMGEDPCNFCSECVYGYLIEHLKANIPQLTKL